MLTRGGGSMVFTSSFVGYTAGLPQMAAYAASKAGLIGLTQALAVEFALRGIRVNALLPGGTDTPMGRTAASTPEAMAFVCGLHALKRIAAPEEIAQSALYLASDASSFTTGYGAARRWWHIHQSNLTVSEPRHVLLFPSCSTDAVVDVAPSNVGVPALRDRRSGSSWMHHVALSARRPRKRRPMSRNTSGSRSSVSGSTVVIGQRAASRDAQSGCPCAVRRLASRAPPPVPSTNQYVRPQSPNIAPERGDSALRCHKQRQHVEAGVLIRCLQPSVVAGRTLDEGERFRLSHQ